MVSRKQFAVLMALSNFGRMSQRELMSETGLSLGTVNSVFREYEDLGLVSEGALSDAGKAALEPFRVDNAVILAAGMSQRFAPISYEKPKGVLRVRGEVLIERQIRQLHEANITDITVVVGYKKEFFFYLAEEYGVHIVVNDDFGVRNNNSSLWVTRDRLTNTYVCSSDNYFTVNPFEEYVYQAYYSAQFVEGETEEWCLTTGSGNRITKVSVGGRDSWIMLGHAYFDRSFSKDFVHILEEEYTRPETASKLWEAIYADHVRDLDMVMRPYPAGVINEFDSLDELRGFDPSFIENVDSEVFDNIVSVLHCQKADIGDFYPLKQGLTNLSCHFSVGGAEYVYRHPGAGTENMVDREAEAAALMLAKRLKLDRTFVAADPRRGWKISKFIPDVRNLDVSKDSELELAMRMDRALHESGEKLDKEFDFITAGKEYEALLKESGPIEVPGYGALREKVMRLKRYADADGYSQVPSHNDFFPLNFLVDEQGRADLIDWEYAGMSDIANDFGTFCVCAQLTDRQAEKALAFYFERTPTFEEKRHFWAYIVFAGWCWYVWSLAKEAVGDNVGEWLYIYYRHAAENIDLVLRWYEQTTRFDIGEERP